MLNGLGKINNYMPPFLGTRAEREALAVYIVEELQGQTNQPSPSETRDLAFDIPPHSSQEEYVLLAWNNLGMHFISDSDPFWIFLPPGNDLFAQLVHKGELPEVVSEGVKLRYRVEAGFENPSGQVRFWEFSRPLMGKNIPENIGVSGNPVTGGEMAWNLEANAFEASQVPMVPYPDNGTFNPYPLYTVEAVEEATGTVLAVTRFVAPTSTEMGCKNCHGGGWRVAGVAGFTDETAADVLKVHDRINRTDLLERARAGNPMLCQSCHADPIFGTEGKPGISNFSTAIHGFHAYYLTDRGTEACFKCHPSSASGPTVCLRGVHAGLGLNCTQCHGFLEDHALSLLKYEKAQGKAVDKLMHHLAPRTASSLQDIKPRRPWVNEPDCLNCHVDFEKPAARDVSGFNQWTQSFAGLFRMRTDDVGLMCEACHGAPPCQLPGHQHIREGSGQYSAAAISGQQPARRCGQQLCAVSHHGDGRQRSPSKHAARFSQPAADADHPGSRPRLRPILTEDCRLKPSSDGDDCRHPAGRNGAFRVETVSIEWLYPLLCTFLPPFFQQPIDGIARLIRIRFR